MFVHTVYFWLKPELSTERASALREALEGLDRVETVRHIFVGTPLPAERGVVDDSYSLGLTVIFDDKSGHDKYQDHPLHQDFVKQFKDDWDRIVVYDYE